MHCTPVAGRPHFAFHSILMASWPCTFPINLITQTSKQSRPRLIQAGRGWCCSGGHLPPPAAQSSILLNQGSHGGPSLHSDLVLDSLDTHSLQAMARCSASAVIRARQATAAAVGAAKACHTAAAAVGLAQLAPHTSKVALPLHQTGRNPSTEGFGPCVR